MRREYAILLVGLLHKEKSKRNRPVWGRRPYTKAIMDEAERMENLKQSVTNLAKYERNFGGKQMLVKLRKGQRGFTLVELLVTIAILGTLFGIVTLALNGLTASTTANVKAAEFDQVQTSVDIYLADLYPGTTVIPVRVAAAVIASANTDAPFKTFLRSLPTLYTYSWDTDGNVTQP